MRDEHASVVRDTRRMVSRVGARVLLLDSAGRVLLIHERVESPAGTHWLTPGGGLEGDEPLYRTAAREAFEETGIRVQLGPDAAVIHHQRRQWSWRGTSYDQLDHFFLATVSSAPTITPTALTAMERETVIEHRWWTVEELRASREVFEPPDIADLVERFARG